MRALFVLIALTPVMAQSEAPQVSPAPAQTTAPAQTASQAPAESPVPRSENWLTGHIDLGYRWNTGPAGSLETYRSVVDLGAGPKLVGADFTITDPEKRYFDTIHGEAYDWADPYSTLRITADKQGLYRFTGSYRSLAYFNNLPSYADPLLSRGITLDEQSYDARRHLGSFELRLLPERKFSPYLGFDHDGDSTHGATVFETNGNQYPVPYTSTNVTNLYRGGLNVILQRLHLTLEEGGTTFRDNENIYASGTNFGNVNTPTLGQTLYLTGLVQTWGIRGTGTYTRAVLTASPLSRLDVYGHFGYSNLHNDVSYTQYNTGNFVQFSQILFYNGEQFLQSAAARMPHTSGDVGWEIRPWKRWRIQQFWLTDRLHNAGSSAGTDTLLGNGFSVAQPVTGYSFLSTNFSQTETGVSVDVTSTLTARGAWRYVWGDANDLVLPPSGLATINNSKLRRNVGIGSVAWRGFGKLRANADFELARSGNEYFRTSLYNYMRVRFNAQYDVLPSVHLNGDYSILSNGNPLAGSPYYYLYHQESFAVAWAPPGKSLNVDAAYQHCGYHSEISYLDPTYLTSMISNYREYCHDVTLTVNTTLPARLNHARLAVGGSALKTSGSRPTTYYQPTVRLDVPLVHHIQWFTIWQYYAFGETFFPYENFLNHLVTTGLRFSR